MHFSFEVTTKRGRSLTIGYSQHTQVTSDCGATKEATSRRSSITSLKSTPPRVRSTGTRLLRLFKSFGRARSWQEDVTHELAKVPVEPNEDQHDIISSSQTPSTSSLDVVTTDVYNEANRPEVSSISQQLATPDRDRDRDQSRDQNEDQDHFQAPCSGNLTGVADFRSSPTFSFVPSVERLRETSESLQEPPEDVRPSTRRVEEAPDLQAAIDCFVNSIKEDEGSHELLQSRALDAQSRRHVPLRVKSPDLLRITTQVEYTETSSSGITRSKSSPSCASSPLKPQGYPKWAPVDHCGSGADDNDPSLTNKVVPHEEAYESVGRSVEHMWRPYEYQPLNRNVGQEIRLIRLHPGKPTDPIRCDIIHEDLLSRPDYEAVSYTWATENGDSRLTNTIIVGDHYLAVTLNCLYALWRLRREDVIRTLWMDAISINQDKVSERNHQVGLMREIYTAALRVLIYIGESDRQSREIFSGLWQRYFVDGEYIEISIRNAWRSLAGRFRTPEEDWPSGKLAFRPFYESEDFAKLRSLFGRRWFSRVWVIQEAALAKNAILIAGEDTCVLNQEFLHDIRERCRAHNLVVPGPFQFNPGHYHRFDLLEALNSARNCSSTDPRDKLYALIGMADEKTRSAIPIDYSKSVEEVFTRAAAALIERNNSLDVISSAFSIPGFMHGAQSLPTWVPDWTDQVTYLRVPPQFLSDEVGPWRFKTRIKTVSYAEELQEPPPDTSYIVIPPLSKPFPTKRPSLLIVRAHCIGQIKKSTMMDGFWQSAYAFGDMAKRAMVRPFNRWPPFLRWIRKAIRSSPSFSGDQNIDWDDLRVFCEDLKNRWRSSIIFQAGVFPVVSPKHSVNEGDSVWFVDGFRTPLILTRVCDSAEEDSSSDTDDDEDGEKRQDGVHNGMPELVMERNMATRTANEDRSTSTSHRRNLGERRELDSNEVSSQNLTLNNCGQQEAPSKLHSESCLAKEHKNSQEIQRLEQGPEAQDLITLASQLTTEMETPKLPIECIETENHVENKKEEGNKEKKGIKEEEKIEEKDEDKEEEQCEEGLETYEIVGPCYLYGLKDLDCWTPGSAKTEHDFDPFRSMHGQSSIIGIF